MSKTLVQQVRELQTYCEQSAVEMKYETGEAAYGDVAERLEQLVSEPGDYVPGVQKATTTLPENNPEYYAETQVKPYRDALDSIAKVWNSADTNQQDIVNAVGKALRAAGYEQKY